jgi:hypothetical protein
MAEPAPLPDIPPEAPKVEIIPPVPRSIERFSYLVVLLIYRRK